MIVSFGYRFRNSLLETFDPRARWIFSFLLLFSIVNFWDIRFLAFFLVISMAQYASARLTWKETRRAWLFILFLTFVMIVVNTLITSSGTIGDVMASNTVAFEFHIRLPLVGWPVDFVLTVERLWFALAQVVRILAITSLFIVIPFTMNPREYGATFKGVGLSDKIAFTMDLAFRFVPTLARDFSVTLDAQRARGYEIERINSNIFTQIKRVAPLVVPVTMNSILTGEDMTNAMDLRCFDTGPRTWIETLHFKPRDYVMILFGVILFVGSLVLFHGFHIGGFWIPQGLIS